MTIHGCQESRESHDLAIRNDHLYGNRITLTMSMSYRLNMVPSDLLDKPEEPRTMKGVYGTPLPAPVVPLLPLINIHILVVSAAQIELQEVCRVEVEKGKK